MRNEAFTVGPEKNQSVLELWAQRLKLKGMAEEVKLLSP